MAQSCLCNCCDSGWFLRGWVCPAQQSRLNKRTWAPQLENETWKYSVGWGGATYTIFSWTMLDACWGVWGVPFEEPEYQGSSPNGKLRIITYGGDFCDECGCDIRPGAGETSPWTCCHACFAVIYEQLTRLLNTRLRPDLVGHIFHYLQSAVL